MRTLEKIKVIRECINCTHDEARQALIITYGNIPKAIEYIAFRYNRRAL